MNSDPKTILLADRIKTYIAGRDVSKGHRVQLECALRRFEKHLGRPATLADLTADAVNAWLLAMQEEGLSKRTIRGHRGRILSLWNDALDEGIYHVEPRRLRKVKLPRFTPVAWSPVEVARLLAAARSAPRRFRHSRVACNLFWEAFILLMWDTALRLGDVLALKTDTVLGKDSFQVVQGKTGDVVCCRLRPETVEAISRTYPPQREYVFGGAVNKSRLWKKFRALIKDAGLSSVGSTKMIRKSSATAVEAANPGAAMRHLGHRTPDLAYRHYVDPRFINHAKPMPPALPDIERKDGAA